MDYKEKYEQGLECIQEILSSGQEKIKMTLLKERLQPFFPELGESEDELTWLTKFIEEEAYSLSMDIRDNEDRIKLKNLQKSLAWLEKQGEKKQFYIRFGDIPEGEKSSVWRGDEFLRKENGVSVYPAFKHNGNIVLGLSLPITKTTLYTLQHLLEYDNRPCYLVVGDYIGNGADGEPLIRNVEIVEEIKDFRVKEGEERYKIKNSDSLSVNGQPFDHEKATITQKDFEEIVNAVKDTSILDMVEPKFKVGDFILNGDMTNDGKPEIFKIQKICPNWYDVENIYDGRKTIITFNQEWSCKLWNIKDAEDGDVIACNEEILLFKSYSVQGRISLYCWYNERINNFYSKEVTDASLTTKNKICPATKEQRDTLFKKMKEAGYQWDAEKKELKLLISNGGDF